MDAQSTVLAFDFVHLNEFYLCLLHPSQEQGFPNIIGSYDNFINLNIIEIYNTHYYNSKTYTYKKLRELTGRNIFKVQLLVIQPLDHIVQLI